MGFGLTPRPQAIPTLKPIRSYLPPVKVFKLNKPSKVKISIDLAPHLNRKFLSVTLPISPMEFCSSSSCHVFSQSPTPTRRFLIHGYRNSTTHFLCLSTSMPFLQKSQPSSLRSAPNNPLTLIRNLKLNSRNNNSRTSRNLGPQVSNSTSPIPSSAAKQIVFGSALTVMFAVANRVLYKLALVPMKKYPFFLAQLTTFGYVIIYFSILFIRYRAGIVSNEMLAVPKSRFMAIGALEALGAASGMSAAAMLPGPAIPILNQTFLVWQLAFSSVLLGRTYSFNQIAGCLLVATGVTVAVASGSNAGQMLSGIEFVWPALMIASSAFQAGSSIIKEFVFIDAASRLKDKSLDIFVVNSFGSGFQALFLFIFLPFLSRLRGIPFAQLPSYLKSGADCFLNIGTIGSGCTGAPLLPLLYIITNLIFNISLLRLVKVASAVVASLAATLSVPISIFIFSLPLPYLPDAATLSPSFLSGTVILLLGLVLYNIPQPAKQSSEID